MKEALSMEQLQQCKKAFLLILGIVMIVGGVIATVLALKPDAPAPEEIADTPALPE